MKHFRLHAWSLCIGCAVATVAFVAMSQKPAASAPSFEYKIHIDLVDADVKRLVEGGWEYVGYMGTSSRGSGTDETLWKRPSK